MRIYIKVDLDTGYVIPDNIVPQYMRTMLRLIAQAKLGPNTVTELGPIGSSMLIDAFRAAVARRDIDAEADEVFFVIGNHRPYAVDKNGGVEDEFWATHDNLRWEYTQQIIHAMTLYR
jgi:hypothetical protein